MSFLGILLLGISLSMDALGIGVSYGLRSIRIPWAAKLITTAISAAVMAVSILTGNLLSGILPPQLTSLLGAGMLALLGGFVMIQALWRRPAPAKKKRPETCGEPCTVFHLMSRSLGITIQIIRNPPCCDFDKSKSVDALEALYLGFSLSIDSFGVGISSAVSGLNTMAVPAAAALFQLAFLTVGTQLGKKISLFSKLDSSVWMLLSGVLLICIAALRLFFS